MAEFRNTFSWSFSRHKTFAECRRRYYWHYYGSWGGWSPDGPDDARLAYRFKRMQSLPMWLGDLVHRMIERILGDMRNQETNTLDAYQKQTRAWMNREWKQSLDGLWKWKPKYNLNLFEHYYGVEITPKDREAARDKVFNCLANFMTSEIFDRITRLKPAEWKTIESLEQFLVGGCPAYLKIDCATQSEGRVSIYDWKTGRESDDTLTQLACYALYACQTWGVPVEKQILIPFYLDSGSFSETVPAAETLIETKDFILRSIGEMTAALDSTMEENHASPANFALRDTPSICKRCFYYELCYHTRNLPS
ncbi:PD-(D/E)XK nuclease family protein [bacterium]|nr:PD-(D/E)XK nuclease family protein [bacterium]